MSSSADYDWTVTFKVQGSQYPLELEIDVTFKLLDTRKHISLLQGSDCLRLVS